MSGGERQRISIARAMLKSSKIVILDEATSSIDPENEEQLNIALKHLLANKTLLIIAHKLETISNAEQIIVMGKGKIESTGTHHELIQNSSIYRYFLSQWKEAVNWKLSM